jgi:hypothetical protein
VPGPVFDRGESRPSLPSQFHTQNGRPRSHGAIATQLLAHAGLAQSPAPLEYKPTRAGGGGALRTLFSQAPTLLNPHFVVGAKDAEGAGILRAASLLGSGRQSRPDARR